MAQDRKTPETPENKPSADRRYKTLEETAKYLNISTEHLLRLRERGLIQGVSERGTWRFMHDVAHALSLHLKKHPEDRDPAQKSTKKKKDNI